MAHPPEFNANGWPTDPARVKRVLWTLVIVVNCVLWGWAAWCAYRDPTIDRFVSWQVVVIWLLSLYSVYDAIEKNAVRLSRGE